MFKVPQLPARLSSQEEDVFGPSASSSGNESRPSKEIREKPQLPGFDELEKANRTVCAPHSLPLDLAYAHEYLHR